MADFVPSTIIQTPDFLGMAQQRQNQIKKEKLATANFISDYKQTGENYLEGFIPGVQQEWNQVESAMNAVAADDNISTRRALDNAYANYARVAGTAKALTEGYHTNLSAFRADPSSFGLSYSEVDDLSKMYRYSSRTPDGILADSDFVIPKSKEFELKNPVDMAEELISKLDDRIKTEFYNENTGRYNTTAILDEVRWMTNTYVNKDPDNLNMATVWGGLDLGLTGQKKIRNEAEYQFIMSQPEEMLGKMSLRFEDAVVEASKKLIPREGTQLSEQGKEAKSLEGMSGYKLPSLLVYGSKSGLSKDVTAFPIPEDKQIETSKKYDEVKDAQGRSKELKENITEVMVDANGQILVKVQGRFKDKNGKSLPPGVAAVLTGVGGVEVDSMRDVYTTIRPADPSEITRLENSGFKDVISKMKQGNLDLSVNVSDPAGLNASNNSVNSQGVGSLKLPLQAKP